jgi:hypothetical protein
LVWSKDKCGRTLPHVILGEGHFENLL